MRIRILFPSPVVAPISEAPCCVPSADPYSARVESRKTPDYEESISILPFAVAVSGGVELNPGAGILRIDGPGYCYTWNEVRGDEGVMATARSRSCTTTGAGSPGSGSA